MRGKRTFAFLVFLIACAALGYAVPRPGSAAAAPHLAGVSSHLYKETSSRPLFLYALQPGPRYPGARPAVIFFFGGGWTGGTKDQFDAQARYFAKRGFVSVLADYRVKTLDGSTPFDSVRDARSAVRWVRAHARDLQVDPSRIVAAGASAGGHLAAAAAILVDLNDASDDRSVSSVPNALVLLNPVLDTSKIGYGAKLLGDRAPELSLTAHVGRGLPPTLILHGTADTIVPFENSVEFKRVAEAAGNRCDLVVFEGAEHGFFNSPEFDAQASKKLYVEALADIDAFLRDVAIER